MVWERIQEVAIDSTDDHKELDFSPSGDWIAVITDTVGVQIFDTSDWTEATYIQKSGWDSNVTSVDFSPDGQYLAIGDQAIGLSIYDASDADPANWTEISASPLYTSGYVEGSGWTRNTSHVALANAYNDVRVYSTNDWSEVSNSPFFDASGNLEAVSANDSYMVGGGDESGSIFVLDLDTMSEHSSSPISHPYGAMDVMEFSPSGNYLLIGFASNELVVFDTSDDSDPANWTEITESPLYTFGGDVEGAAWYANDSYSVGASLSDGDARVFDSDWNEISESPVDQISGITSADFDTNNEWLALLDRNGNAIDIHDAPAVASTEDIALSTVDGSAVSETEVSLTGSLDDLFTHDAGLMGFQWRQEGSTNAYNNTSLQTLTSTGQYTTNVTGLSSGTTYEFRAVGNNGNIGVATNSANNIDTSSMTLNGDLTELDGFADADVYFEYKKSSASTWNSTSATTVTSTGSFSDDVTGLDSDTTYDYRAVATDGTLTKTGSTMSDSTTAASTYPIMVESFEDGDMAEWEDPSDSYVVTDNPSSGGSATDGSYVMERDGSDFESAKSVSQSDYPERGEVFEVDGYPASSGEFLYIEFGVNQTSNYNDRGDHYSLMLGNEDSWELRKYVGGTETVLDTVSHTHDLQDTVMTFRVTWGDPTITCELIDDTDTVLETVSADDTEYDSGGIGVRNSGATSWWDRFEITGSV